MSQGQAGQSQMRTVDEHVAAALRLVRPLPAVELDLADAQGLRLAEDIVVDTPLPPFDNSSMDGYAVRLDDVAEATQERPAVLRVVADIPAGAFSDVRLGVGQCARIMTGAPVPAGTEAIVPVEWTDAGTEQVRVHRPATPAGYIRHRGDDVAEGETVLRAGARLGARHIALAAALGRQRIRAVARPRVVVLSTGSELVEPGGTLTRGQTYDSNSHMLAAAVRAAGAIAERVGGVRDDPQALLDVIERHAEHADLIITSGGVSVGAYDVVKQVLSRLGTVAFTKVAMQPGMPQGLGVVGDPQVPIFTLPGNPVSSYVSFEMFVRPALRAMLGYSDPLRPVVRARSDQEFGSPAGRRQFMRGQLVAPGDGAVRVVRPVGGGGSHLLGGLALADCLIVVPEDVTHVNAGDALDVVVLDEH